MENAWLNHVQSLCEASLEKPMWGHLPSFPFEAFAERLSSALSIEGLSISVGKADWTESSLEGMGDHPTSIGIQFSPVATACFWVMDESDIKRLCSWSFGRNETFTDSDLERGFYQYVLLEALNTLVNEGVYSDFSPKLTTSSLKEELSYAVDVTVSRGDESIFGRLICPKAFWEGVRDHYSEKRVPLREYALAEKVLLNLQVGVGQTTLAIQEWDRAKVGDLLVLDSCSYSPRDEKGYFQLQLAGKPVFQVKLKEDHIKILDFAYHSEDQTMTDEGLFPDPFQEQKLPEVPETPPPEEEVEAEEIVEEISPEEEVAEEIEVQENEIVAADSVNLSLVVEVAKLQMPLDQLLNLKPGNTLPLSIKPSQGVTITLNGQAVGRGQLLQMDELLGVKITEI